MINYPEELIPIFDMEATYILKTRLEEGPDGAAMRDEDEEAVRTVQVRPFNLRETHHIRQIDPIHIDKFIQVKGIVIRCSDVVPEMKNAYF